MDVSKFTLITDHKPLTLLAILGPKKGIHPLAAARRLSYCQHTVTIFNSNQLQHTQMQMVSRLPLSDTTTQDQSVEVSLFNVVYR